MVCTTSEATACTVMRPDGTMTHHLVLAESEGYALVRRDDRERWVQVCLGDLDLDDDDDLDDVVAAVIKYAFAPSGGGR